MTSEQIYYFVQSAQGQAQQNLANALIALNDSMNSLKQRHIAVVNYIVQRDNLKTQQQAAELRSSVPENIPPRAKAQ